MDLSDINRPAVWSWACYDWANSAFSTVVMAGFFPIFFKQFWSAGVSATESTYQLGLINSAASLIIVVLAPVLGAIADQLGRRKGFLLLFACFGAVATGSLYWVEQGHWQMASFLYVAAIIGFSGANLFYDALLPLVSPAQWFDRVSALGFALGYLGGGLLFAFNVWMTLSPDLFGLDGASDAVRLSFILTGAWWLLFSLPLLLFVKETNPLVTMPLKAIGSGFAQLGRTFGKIRELPQTFKFLLAYALYIDGVDTIIRMAVDYGLAIGLESSDLITALLLTQFVGFPAALLFGRIGERFGARAGILLAIGVYFAVTLYSAWMQSAWQFYLLAIVIGLVQGGVQALSRSLFARLIPPGHTAEFFGFYNMLGKFAAVLGPILVGWTAVMFDSSRISILSILLLFAGGAYLLSRVNIVSGQRQAADFR
ncbi:MFS transporter [Motiliproteus sp. MSK22-1]|uniref:MFS transporter n=1 Tax=Motiliproteus sp. MSK22-1 TaxID=1897630 RepID=UPI000976FDB2|nr:MFS transporter [Motiliproteus sp. MSK22-1]OMH25777.1 MFS transporter [Motiliproteus sp. MSK22-1]